MARLIGSSGAGQHPPDPHTGNPTGREGMIRLIPSMPNRAMFTAAANNEKSASTFVLPRTLARRPPCLRRIKCPILRSTFGRVARYSARHPGSRCKVRARTSSSS